MLCIICRLDKDDMSDEHVIPDSLNGYYHIYNVCKACNSSMGDKIDAPLVNHQLTKLYRSKHGIAGKSGKIPNPFSGVFYSKDNPEEKARVDRDQDGNYEVIYYPRIDVGNDDNGEVQRIEIEVNSKFEDKIDELFQKILIRKNVPKTAIFDSERRREERDGEVVTRWGIDTLMFKIGLLKIAYEFAVDSIPEYFMSADAIKISEILKNADYQSCEESVKMGSGFDFELLTPFFDYLDLESNNHYLILVPTEDGLLCVVRLSQLFTIGISLSSKCVIDFTNTIVGVNDSSKKTFRKYLLSDLICECFSRKSSRFQYCFPNGIGNSKFISEINSPTYRYEGEGNIDTVVLYKKDGDKNPTSLSFLLKNSPFNSRKNGNLLINRYVFYGSKEFYVKSVNSGNLFHVVGFEESLEQIKKV